MTNREQFLHNLNKAFAKNDVDYITNCVSDDIKWIMVGDDTIRGKANVARSLNEMSNGVPFTLQIGDLIIHQNKAVVEGNMTSPKGEAYAFCDIYTFADRENPLIKEMSSYVIALSKQPMRV